MDAKRRKIDRSNNKINKDESINKNFFSNSPFPFHNVEYHILENNQKLLENNQKLSENSQKQSEEILRLQSVIINDNYTINQLMQQNNEIINKVKEQNIMINILKDEIEAIKKGKNSFYASSTDRWDNTPSYIN